jgi:hypothetical protein
MWSTTLLGKLWRVSSIAVYKWCFAGLIPGAVQAGVDWRIPVEVANAVLVAAYNRGVTKNCWGRTRLRAGKPTSGLLKELYRRDNA